MAAARGKGTVTPLSSIFPAEEARKASQIVQDSIAEKHKELDHLNYFVNDNTNLINLVQRLPDELHHNIMVPFGKSAFFPGRLVHTNELLVLLGDGYFVDRTSKQTVDILKRRGETLESQVDSLKAVLEDLKTEASFFKRTAAEAAEGLVEIREEYTDDDEDSGESQQNPDAPSMSEMDGGTGLMDDEEYARIMSRFDELEKEELEAEDNEEQVEDKHDEDISNLHGNMGLRPSCRDQSSHEKGLPRTHVEQSTVKDYVPSVKKTSLQPASKSKFEDSVLMPKPDVGSQLSRPVTEMPKPNASQLSRPVTDSLKAFTGSIIERTDNLQINHGKETASQPSRSQPSKPVSRFKMQRRAV